MTAMAFLPPSSRLRRLSRCRARVAICAAGLAVAGEADDVDVGLLDDAACRLLRRRPVTRLTMPAGKPASSISSTSSAAQCGVSRRGLEDDRVAADQRRHHLPARDGDREVPGRDDAGDADRLADAHRPLVGQLGGHRVAEHAAPLAGHQVGDVDAFLDVAARLGEDLAHLARHGPRAGAPCARPAAPRSAYRISPRLGAGIRRQAGSASSAARMAAATSAALEAAKWPMSSRVSAGLRDSKVRAALGRPPLAADEVAVGQCVRLIGSVSNEDFGHAGILGAPA